MCDAIARGYYKNSNTLGCRLYMYSLEVLDFRLHGSVVRCTKVPPVGLWTLDYGVFDPPWTLDFRGLTPPWTLDFRVLTPLDFGLRLSELGTCRRVGLGGSPLASRQWRGSHKYFYSDIHPGVSPSFRV